MRMSNTIIPRLAGLSAVDPSTVTGSVYIAGEKYMYARGVLPFEGKQYLVSDDQDLVINDKHVPIGAIVNGHVIALTALPPDLRQKYKRKYGV